MPTIKLKNLTVKYLNKKTKSSFTAINDLNAIFKDGSFNVLVGPSGSGKTTLVKTLAGILEYEGKILFDDVDFKKVSFRKIKISYVDQNINLYPHLTCFENISFPLINLKLKREEIIERVYSLSKKLGISICLSRPPKDLSIGQAQRVALAKALIKEPAILLLDEAFSNLDPAKRDELVKFVKKYAKENNTTVIYVTHNINEAIEIADSIFVIDQGQIIESDVAKKILMSKNSVTQGLIKASFEKVLQ